MEAYASIQRRVDALSVVHRNHFAELEENRGVGVRALIGELSASLRSTAPVAARRFGIQIDSDDLHISQDVAVPIAFLTTELVELAELLMELHPWADMVRYSRTGGEIMAIAVRIARAASGRDKIAFCGYHGWHDYLLASVRPDPKNVGAADEPKTVAISAGALKQTVDQILVAPINDQGAVERIIQRERPQGLLATLALPNFPIRRAWCTVYRRDHFPTPVAELFLRFVREHLSEFQRHFQATGSPLPSHGVSCLPALSLE